MTIKECLKEKVDQYEEIEMMDNKMSGIPVIKNTRIPLALILANLRDGCTIDDICSGYCLCKKDIENTLQFMIDIFDTEE